MRTIAVIPARGGSKGIPLKALVSVAERPLIQYTIEAAQTVADLQDVIVTSDCDRILAAAQDLGATPLKRSSAISLDASPMDAVIADVIDRLLLNPEDVICLLQPTSPLRSAEHITDALNVFKTETPTMVMSVTAASHCPQKAFCVDDQGFARGYFGDDEPFKPRQSFPQLLYANGAIYIFRVESFREASVIPRRGIRPLTMPAIASIDVDTLEDVRLVEAVMRSSL